MREEGESAVRTTLSGGSSERERERRTHRRTEDAHRHVARGRDDDLSARGPPGGAHVADMAPQAHLLALVRAVRPDEVDDAGVAVGPGEEDFVGVGREGEEREGGGGGGGEEGGRGLVERGRVARRGGRGAERVEARRGEEGGGWRDAERGDGDAHGAVARVELEVGRRDEVIERLEVARPGLVTLGDADAGVGRAGGVVGRQPGVLCGNVRVGAREVGEDEGERGLDGEARELDDARGWRGGARCCGHGGRRLGSVESSFEARARCGGTHRAKERRARGGDSSPRHHHLAQCS